jgi:hypothetical protein
VRARDESSVPYSAILLSRPIFASTDRVIWPNALCDERVIKEPDSRETLLDGCFGQAELAVELTYPGSTRMWASVKLMHIPGEVFSSSSLRGKLTLRAEVEILIHYAVVRSSLV